MDQDQYKIVLVYDNEIEEYLENLDGNRSNGLNPVGQTHALSQAIILGYTGESLAQRYQRSTSVCGNSGESLSVIKVDKGTQSTHPINQSFTKSVTWSSLGIKRLSQKKTDRLKFEFLSLTTDLALNAASSDCVTEIKINKQHKDLFSDLNCKYVQDDGDGLNLILNESTLKKLLAILNNDSTVIVIPNSKISELNEIRDMLISDN